MELMSSIVNESILNKDNKLVCSCYF
jgi:hypothetical protein